MKRKIISAVLSTVFLIGILSGCVANTPVDETINISYVSDPEGLGENSPESIVSAMDEIKDYYGDYFDIKSTVYKVKDLEDAKRVSQKAIRDGADLFVGSSYAVNNALSHEINKNSKSIVAMIGNVIRTDKENVVSVTFKGEESAFLAGYLASCTTKTGVVGYIGGYDSDNTEIFAGFYAGAKYKNPDVVVLESYTNSYNNSAKGKKSAEELKNENADVFFVNCGSCALGISEILMGSEVKIIASHQFELSSDEVIGSARYYVKNAAMFVIDEYLNEQLTLTEYRHGISYGFVDLKIMENVPADVREEVSSVRSDIRTSKIKVPVNMQECMEFLGM